MGAASSTNIPPVANAGSDKIIVLPVNTRTFRGSGRDTDGFVTTFPMAQKLMVRTRL